jgi:hypothetical protein
MAAKNIGSISPIEPFYLLWFNARLFVKHGRLDREYPYVP